MKSIYNSNKSGRLVLNSKDNYLKAMKEHYIDDPVITLDDLGKLRSY